jgi:hypothetical protein
MSTRFLSLVIAALATSVALADIPQPSPDQVGAGNAARCRAGGARELRAADSCRCGAFLDGLLPSSMAIGDVAGATVAIVKDDALLLTRGYGFADVEKRIPWIRSRRCSALLRSRSCSPGPAVMQQVEAGKLDLDHDINEYLDFKIEGYGGQPIKLRHLMTHTAGFEESLLDLLVTDINKLKPLGEALKDSIPGAIYPPGTGASVFELRRIARRLHRLARLGRAVRAIYRGPHFQAAADGALDVPSAGAGSAARASVEQLRCCVLGHVGTVRARIGFACRRTVGAGAGHGAIHDGALERRLAAGRRRCEPDLKPETTELMHSAANRPGAGVDAMALGFYEQSRNGVRAIAHGGDLTAFHSELVLVPSAKVGIFVSFNSSGKGNSVYKIRTALYEAFMDRYFPRQAPPQDGPPADPKIHAAAVAGPYEGSRRAEKSLFSFLLHVRPVGGDRQCRRHDPGRRPDRAERPGEEIPRSRTVAVARSRQRDAPRGHARRTG